LRLDSCPRSLKYQAILNGRTADFFESAARCRINAAFRLAFERRIYAAAKNFVVRNSQLCFSLLKQNHLFQFDGRSAPQKTASFKLKRKRVTKGTF